MTESDTLANQWRSISALLDEALLLPVTEHPRWLADLPASVAHLRETLQHFLELHAEVDGRDFLEQPAAPVVDVETPAPLLQPGEIVGPYRAIEELGSGGMGSVWLAERADGKPRRRVALKLPRMVWASDLPERLERERDILAPLEHPNIARLYDAGVDEKGRPFLAIEYVEGVRITEYCKTQKLDVTRRVKLFLQVLSAVQYAHTRLVLHRDLKPANILVNRNGDVRLLDFGIAKLVDEVTATSDLIVATASRALTPRYASPEQLRDERLSLISDVYSLGVILHELLTGESPYPVSAKSRAQIELAVLEGVIALPSRRLLSRGNDTTLDLDPIASSKALRGDLDAVILKALALDPSARYPSVEALRADLDRWLSGRPVLAMPPSLLAAAKKFVLRNRTAVVVSTTAIAAVVLMTVIALYQADKAIAESQRAAATRDFLIHMFESANPELNGGREATVRELVSKAESAVSSELDGQPLVQAEIMGSLVNAWLNLGDHVRAKQALGRKISALKDTREIASLAAAQLDQATLLIGLESFEAASGLISEVSDSKVYNKLSVEDQTRLIWLDAWLDYSSGNYRSALRKFESSEGLAIRSDLKALRISALYGQALSQKLLGDWLAARKALSIATSHFSDLGKDDRHALIGVKEIAAAHISLGTYEDGWQFLNHLIKSEPVEEVSRLKRPADLYFYWASLGMKLGKLSAREKAEIARFEFGVTQNDLRLKAMLMRAMIFVDIGRFDLAEEMFASAEIFPVTNAAEKSLQVQVYRLLASLKRNQLSESAAYEKAISTLLSKRRFSDETSALANRVVGIYQMSRDNLEGAATQLLRSAEIYKGAFGAQHPTYLECILALYLIESLGYKLHFGNYEAMPLDLLVGLLKEAYPVEHPVVRYAKLMEREKAGVSQQIQQTERRGAYVDVLLQF